MIVGDEQYSGGGFLAHKLVLIHLKPEGLSKRVGKSKGLESGKDKILIRIPSFKGRS